MLAEIGPFQALLDAIGWLLAWLYDLTGNFGFAIIILTIVFRVVLLPLGIKQIKSMQAMQALGPKIKEIQKKYKGNKQKIQEQTMALYQEYGVNPLGGCLPLLLQFPILIAMYAVIRAPVPYAETPGPRSKPPGVDVQGQPPPGGLAALHRHHDARRRSHALPPHEPAVRAVAVREDGPRAQHAEGAEWSHARLRGLDTGPDPVLRVAGPHDRIDLLLESPDAEGDARVCAEPADPDHHEGHAADVRRVRLRLPGGPDPVLDGRRTSSRSGSRP